MIKTENLTKQFDTTTASIAFPPPLRRAESTGWSAPTARASPPCCGCWQASTAPTSGSVEIDGEPVFENPALKQKIFFIPDELYQMPGASLDSLANIYRAPLPQLVGRALPGAGGTLPHPAGAQALCLLQGHAAADRHHSGAEQPAQIPAARRGL